VVKLAWLIEPSEWWSIYRDLITSRLKLSFHRDQEAADLLSKILIRHPYATTAEYLLGRIRGKELAVIVGCSERADLELEYTLRWIKQSGITATIVAADGAVRTLIDRDVPLDLIVTDLDSDMKLLLEESNRGVPIVVHAHGDNIEKLESTIPLIRGPVTGSTQVEPRPLVYNFGGFTDGDRAAYILYHAGYVRILLVGFDFNKPHSCPGKVLCDPLLKLEKLKVARTLLLMLSRRGVELLKVNCSGGSCSQVLLS
jgi:uncharacterized Rossmann fold enzyme